MGFNPTVNLRFLDAKKGSRESSPCRRPAKAWRSMEEEDEPIESRAERVARLKAMIAAHSGGDGGSGGAAPGEGPATGKLINPLVDGSFGPSGVDIDPTAIHGKPIPARLLPYTTSPEIAPPRMPRRGWSTTGSLRRASSTGNNPRSRGCTPSRFPRPHHHPSSSHRVLEALSALGAPAPARGYPPPPGGYPPPPPMPGGHFGGGRGGAGGGGRGGNRGVKRDRGVGGRGGGRDGGDDDPSAYVKRSMVEDPWAHLGGGHRRRDGGSSEGSAAAHHQAGSSSGAGVDPQRHRLFDSLDA